MAEGPEVHIHKALMERVESLSLTPALTLHYAGAENPIDPSKEFAIVTHVPNTPVRWGLGATTFIKDYMGVLFLNLYSPITASSYEIQSKVRAGKILGHFPENLILTSGGVSVQVYNAYLGPAGENSSRVHFITPVLVEYKGTA